MVLEKEHTEKFKHFINQCSDHIDHHPLSLFFQSASGSSSAITSNSPPTTFELWEAALIYLIPEIYLKYLNGKQNGRKTDFDILIDQFCRLTDYAPQHSIKKILQSSLLSKIPDLDLDLWIGFLFNFNTQINSWIKGYWNKNLTIDKQRTIYQITKTLQFKHPWETVSFLNDLGYPVFFSQKVKMVWQHFSGKTDLNIDYSEWVNLFQSLNISELEQLNIERITDYFISYSAQNQQLNYCCGLEACSHCFLKENCCFYRQHFHVRQDEYIETQVKLDKVRSIDSQDLIIYLLKEYWQGSENQKQYLAKYPDIEIQDLLINQNSSKDEAFFIRLTAIQNLIERDDLAPKIQEGKSFTNSESIYNFYRFSLSRKKQESFFILILDNKHRTIKLQKISQGILNKSLVHPREVFAPAIQLRAAAIILIHNHPSGDPTPSTADINITRRLVQVGEIVGISVLDHVIIGKNSYYSFVDEDRMPTN